MNGAETFKASVLTKVTVKTLQVSGGSFIVIARLFVRLNFTAHKYAHLVTRILTLLPANIDFLCVQIRQILVTVVSSTVLLVTF